MKISAGNNIHNKKKAEREITLREAYEFVTQRWYWFLFSIFICMSLTWVYLETHQPTYQRAATLLIDEDKKDYGEEVFIVNASSNNKKQNKVHILSSSELMREVVKKLSLDVSYQEKLLLRMQDIYKQSPITVEFLDEYSLPVNIQVTPISLENCMLTIHKKQYNIAYNSPYKTEAGQLIVTTTPHLNTNWYGKPVYVSRVSPELAAIHYRKNVTPIGLDESSMYIINFASTSITKADDVLYALTDAYNNYSESDKRREANNTARFLSDRIAQISEELGVLSNELTGVQMNKNIASFESAGSQYAQESSKIRDESIQLETKQSLARYIQNYVTDAATENVLIPNMGGVSEMGIDAQVQSYNNALVQRNRLIENSGKNNSVVMGLETSLASTRAAITKTINAYIEGLDIRLEQTRKQARSVQYSLTADPTVYDSYRQKKIKESLYTLLLQKQEENALKMSNTDPVAKIIERPHSSAKPTPDYLKYLVSALLVAISIPIALWWLIVLLDPKIRNRQDIENVTDIPILGEIPAFVPRKEDAGKRIAVNLSNDNPINESFRILSTQVIFALRTSKVIMLTSSTLGEGKTFISNNLSSMLNMLGQRVILVDMDIRKSLRMKQGLTVEEGAGVSDFLAGNATDLESLIIKNQGTGLPDILLAGNLPTNPVEVLIGKRLELMVEELKKQYDIVILDSVPAMGLADALTIERVADLTLYVVREQVLDRRILPEINKFVESDKLRNVHIVLNDCQYLKRDYKGYYNHSRYYGYSYGSYYSNERGKKRNRTAMAQ